MAARGGLILVALAAAAALLGRKKKNGNGIEVKPLEPDMDPIPGVSPPKESGMMPPAVPFPQDWQKRFFSALEETVDECFGELGMVDDVQIRICTLERIFPEAPWPPPANRHPWQNSVWNHPKLKNYIRDKYPPPT